MSESSKIHSRGTIYYLQAWEASGEQQQRLLELAVGLFEKALTAATDTADKISAHKQLAAAKSRLAVCNEQQGTDTKRKVELLTQAVQHRCHVLKIRGDVDPWSETELWLEDGSDRSWAQVELNKLQKVLSSWVAASPASTAAVLHHVNVLRSVLPDSGLQSLLPDFMSELLRSIRNTAANLISPTAKRAGAAEPDWKTCLGMLALAKRTLIEALEVAVEEEDDEFGEYLCKLEDGMWAMQCRCESAQARLQGDHLLARVLAQHCSAASSAQKEQVLDGVLDVLDTFKSAALLARERDLQAEAQALSRLGHTYKVFACVLDPTLKRDPLTSRSAEERSRAAFLQVLGLVDSMPHRITLMMEDWYREARDALSEYQRTTAAEETSRKEKEAAPIREALKDELKELYAASNKGWLDLLKHCYAKHPPVNPASRVTDFTGCNAETGKEWLKKAIVAYHPDKQHGDMKWKVLAEDITKELTDKYRIFK